jgi:hypothetical protein
MFLGGTGARYGSAVANSSTMKVGMHWYAGCGQPRWNNDAKTDVAL